MKSILRSVIIFACGFGVAALALRGKAAETDRSPEPIKVIRIFTGEDNQTHVEELNVELSRRGAGGGLSEPVDVTSLIFRRTPADYFIDWHNAPRRQYVITLSGEAEVELGDGTKVALRPGTILLAEDVEGQGHISRGVGTEERVSLFIPLAE
ncbi:hypothetical protein IIC65_07805 [Candidatus Sumerlaeota bacterium]|nr:hypothetical protein [Candidatus Sumerlaeota bacterium]